MRYIVLLTLCTQIIFAHTVTLKEVMHSSHKHNKFTKSLIQKSLALEAKNQADTASDPIEVFASRGRANPHYGSSGYEYSAGFSKKILFGDIRKKDQKITRLKNQANLLEEEMEIRTFHQAIKNLYHQHCIDVDQYQSLRHNYNDFAKLYRKKAKAYSFQEISKTQLMQLDIEKKRLYAKLKEAKMLQEYSKRFLLSKVHIPYTSKTRLSCRDRYPIKRHIKLPKDQFKLSKEAYNKRIESTKTSLERHNAPIDSIDLVAQYDKELDTDKYTIGLSIPLNFSSKRSEKERVAALYDERSTSLKHEETLHQKKSHIRHIKAKLKNSAMMIFSMQNNIKEYRYKLLPLIKKSYELGESSLIEYLLNRQQYHELKSELYLTQKEYYQALFALYSLIETKE